MTPRQPDPHLLVSPVYLAGAGDPDRLHAALDAQREWGRTSSGTARLYVSPRLDVHIAYLPDSPYGSWKISHYPKPLGVPEWTATFSRHTPVEVAAAFTDALIACVAAGRPYPWHSGPTPGEDPCVAARVLTRHGWPASDLAGDRYYRSPDGHAYFSERGYDVDPHRELHGAAPPAQTMYACVGQAGGDRWFADFTARTPTYLLTQAAHVFSSPEPVQRTRSAIPPRNLPFLTTRPLPDQAPEQRRSAALARTPHPTTTAKPTSPPPAAQPQPPTPPGTPRRR